MRNESERYYKRDEGHRQRHETFSYNEELLNYVHKRGRQQEQVVYYERSRRTIELITDYDKDEEHEERKRHKHKRHRAHRTEDEPERRRKHEEEQTTVRYRSERDETRRHKSHRTREESGRRRHNGRELSEDDVVEVHGSSSDEEVQEQIHKQRKHRRKSESASESLEDIDTSDSDDSDGKTSEEEAPRCKKRREKSNQREESDSDDGNRHSKGSSSDGSRRKKKHSKGKHKTRKDPELEGVDEANRRRIVRGERPLKAHELDSSDEEAAGQGDALVKQEPLEEEEPAASSQNARQRGDVTIKQEPGVSNVKIEPDLSCVKYEDEESGSRRRRNGASRFAQAEPEQQWGQQKDNKPAANGDKQKPNFELSGKLAEDTNMYNGVVVKYSEPPEARMPKRRWRLYPFKGDESLKPLYIHRQSAYLMGRDRKVADIPIDHPSCSKQHAALQYRLVPFKRTNGTMGKQIRLYIIDLESANGTFINNTKIESKKYVELMERDVVKFGFSSREYVLLHEQSKDEAADDDVN